MIELKNVKKSFPDAAGGEERVVLDGITLSVNRGDRMAIAGPSGCGKSTLLNLLGTLDQPSSGEVHIDGREVSGCSENELAAIRSEKIGFIFQLHHLLPQSTVLENVMLPSLALPERSSREEVRKRAEELLDRVGIAAQRDLKPHQISGGERQRAAVVRALINDPGVILADEPTGALDQKRAGELVDLLVELNEERNVAIVMVSHDMELAAQMGKIFRIDEGKLVE